ncbi:MAG: hypothetical protein ABIE74_06540 [Pseudomonadota bacterium]
MKLIPCVFCGEQIEVMGVVGRGDTCPKCRHNLRCCLQCKFHDKSCNNQCHEIMAERVVDKEASNFCNYFSMGGEPVEGIDHSIEKTKKKLEELFKK